MDNNDQVRDALRRRLQPRRAGGAPGSVLGAGADDEIVVAAGRTFLDALTDTPYAVPTWPLEHGGMTATAVQARAIAEALAEFEVPDLYPFLIGLAIAGPTIAECATSEQQRRWLPRIKSGEEIWCQLFSEPDAGSDLANVATTAARDGDEWRLTGSKVWTSRGHYAERGLLLARHDPSLPKHRGITAFGIDMHASGVEVRPLRQMNGDAHFSQVFLNDVVVPDRDRISGVGDGWSIALTALAFERGAVVGGGAGLDFSALVDIARRNGNNTDPRVRQQLATVFVALRLQSLTARRARDNARSGRPGPEGSGAKLRGGAAFKQYAGLALRLLGADGLLGDGPWHTLFLTAPSLSIRGGTDEIQRNIIGERVLGLAEEPRFDRDQPFSTSRQL